MSADLSKFVPSGLAAQLSDAARSSLASRLASQLETMFGLDMTTRLYTVEIEGFSGQGGGNLCFEAFVGDESLSSLYAFDILLLSGNAGIPLNTLVGRQLRFNTRLSDGADFARSGYISRVERLAADGSLTRYRLRVVPWLWLATQRSDCRVFQDKTVLEIIEAVFATYAPRAHWQLAEGVESFMADAPVRSYCVQYRETDFDFVARLLAEEGLGYCFVERADVELAAETAHSLLIFSGNDSLPEDVVSAHTLGGTGIRFHRAASQESQDAITAFGGERVLQAAISTALSWDYKAKAAITASLPTSHAFGSHNAPLLERYDVPGAYAFANAAAADRYVRIAREASEARYKHFAGAGSVRSFRAGHRFVLSGSELDAQALLRGESADADQANASRHFLVLDVQHAGINNLPKGLASAAAELGDAATALTSTQPACTALIASARARGYANQFHAQRTAVPWRPALVDETGLRINPRSSTGRPEMTDSPLGGSRVFDPARGHIKPTAPGVQTAIVVGAEGETTAGAAGEIHTDSLHRVRVKFHWQRDSSEGASAPHTTWLRVASRYAGASLGAQFVPRIGQEVLVGFLEGDIDRPIVLGSLYNGQGDGGILPSPGGAHSPLPTPDSHSSKPPITSPLRKATSPMATARPGTARPAPTAHSATPQPCPASSRPSMVTQMRLPTPASASWYSTTPTASNACNSPPRRP